METADQVSEFRHEPLDDPRACIRLLRVLSIDLGRDIPVHCELSTWPDIEGAPKYDAISYTWGEELPVSTIVVNGKQMSVRSNCEYVLRQTSPYVKDGYLWIDAVCINQSDDDEKGEQVAKMGEVFKNATQVFACVGQHMDDSEILYNMMQKDERYFHSWRNFALVEESIYFHPIYRYPKALFWKLKLKFRNVAIARLRKALKAFLTRPYFQRVWIYQELFLAQVVNVICSHDIVPISWIWMTCLVLHVEISWLNGRFTLWCELDSVLQPREELLKAGSTSRGLMSIEIAMDKVESLHCQDPRDRFYGTLSMINWEGEEPIQPVYNKDRLDLAIEVLNRLGYKSDLGILLMYASDIGTMLELDSKPSQKLTDSVNHRMSANLETTDTDLHRLSNDLSDATGINTCYLTGLRLSYHRGQWRFQRGTKAKIIKTIDQWKRESPKNHQLLSSDILLPLEAQDGDWLLLSKWNMRRDPHALLARDLDDGSGRWELIGKVLITGPQDSLRIWKRLVDNLDPVLKIYLDAEDVLCLLSSLQWTRRHDRKDPWDETMVTGYFETRLCRKRYSSFAIRESMPTVLAQ